LPPRSTLFPYTTLFRSSLTLQEQLAMLHSCLVVTGLMPRRTSPELLRGPLRAFAMALRASFVPQDVPCDHVILLLASNPRVDARDRKSTRLNSSHRTIS